MTLWQEKYVRTRLCSDVNKYDMILMELWTSDWFWSDLEVNSLSLSSLFIEVMSGENVKWAHMGRSIQTDKRKSYRQS